jgi:hypothetical protein
MAKTTGKISGNIILVSKGGTTVGCTTDASLQLTRERIETTCKDDGGVRTYVKGSLESTINATVITKFDTASNLTLLMTAVMEGDPETIQYGGLDNADDPYVEFEGFISDLTWTGPMNAPSNIQFTISPSGPPSLFNT